MPYSREYYEASLDYDPNDDRDDDYSPPRPAFRCCDGLCGGSDCERCHPEGKDEESEDEE